VAAVEAFLRELDAAWHHPGPKIPLRIIGSTALMLQTSYQRGTKDSEVLETSAARGQTGASRAARPSSCTCAEVRILPAREQSDDVAPGQL